jgi:formylglycine-generating enzyme required for sulfatase activity
MNKQTPLNCLILCTLFLFSLHSPADDRCISHLTKDGGLFQTRIIIRNLGDGQGVLRMQPYGQDGTAFLPATRILEGKEVIYTSPLSLFGSSSISHFTISGDDFVKVTVNYTSIFDHGSPVHIHETSIQSKAWLIYPANWESVWDGLAVVNFNDQETQLKINQRDSAGVVIRTISLGNLTANSKKLYLPGTEFSGVQDSVFEVISTLPVAITALQGDYTQKFLWVNTPIPFSNPVNSTVEKSFRLANSQVYVTMIWIPAGQFTMGNPASQDAGEDESPSHTVKFNSGYWIGKFEVNQSQWETIMGPWSFCELDPDHPADNLSWDDARQFIEHLNELEPSHPWRLPSESEWEYACRAGNQETRFWWGDDPQYETLPDHAWIDENSFKHAHDAGTTTAGVSNPFGLWDMHGNVREWCEDDYHPNYQNAPSDGSAWEGESGNKIIRGGSAWSQPVWCLPTRRDAIPHLDTGCSTGFRLARDY